MEILKIEDYKKNRKLVYLEEDTPAFCLYAKEVSRFDLKEGAELTDETYRGITELLTKRARERALYLLADMARTEHQLRKKLRDGMYPEEAIESAVTFCRDKHYIDDKDYAERYISSKSGSLSRRMIEKKLYEKGISREIASAAFEELPDVEEDTIKALIEKKYGDISDLSYEEKQKAVRRLMSAGFAYETIRKALDGLS